MTFRCLVSDCLWSDGTPCRLGNEDVLEQHCLRCGALRYIQLFCPIA
ncbi:PSPA7_2676 family Cys-rich small protein [Pseudomonas indica]